MKDSKDTHFGFKQVPWEEKKNLVARVFDSVADRYDIMNDLMSFGIHRMWKRFFAEFAHIQPQMQILDLAAGTADISYLISKRLGPEGFVVASDINGNMLSNGRDKMINRGVVDKIKYCIANAEVLPFPDNSFDRVTIAFGLRNVTDKDKALKEMHRVLKPQGQALILEFSNVKSEMMQKAYDLYSFHILPKIGQIVAQDGESYQYLAESIRKHPDQETLKDMLLDAGFYHADYTNMLNGVVAIHRGFKKA
ncbi:MAG TPA: bifunctional demethylmenaquinone methyltransferase/2-methoxy-6-polyprenyl-1,4-benzoquinol methylase UbiE [Gammaproteobacteria bacterium]|nr:bifunctional demethylmenaquinone methyltransferase/2-methoxy-6-polyprenyl-1,4-benzoquinol methylase UbiE [Gammaproteobacteria bacterium]HBF10091.1 bifunctional demethylmenaquinone methyltransferase/2-methoxy-6-polyprenyl-1,4-benzoquinol methylase UbiE [Gammaproteobacteria bacterium]HCK94458.1 bifunctional demethylmenaquinone methyltransferase/2-methoxy-6-polyprenyl-1,4-benzoquinol methylase UbiE [Gammaproteobacteria bacterium]|tara:strand:+ start:1112 stop:1864 length:753 start_codon:yes stop_codon:yes gene_type:complete